MERSKISLCITLALLIGCSDDLELTPSSLEKNRNRIENLLTRNWRYEYIKVDNVIYTAVEVGINNPGDFPYIEAMELFRRRIKYDDNRFYMLNWIEFGEYNLDELQPRDGTWQLSDDRLGLIHNPGEWYQVEYRITKLTENEFLRKSIRWIEGEEKEFYEYLVPVDN